MELVALAGPLEGRHFELPRARTLKIGRAVRGLQLPDPLVSMEHAEITWVTDAFWITDLESKSGTWVSGQKVGRKPVRIQPGAEIRIGESVLLLQEHKELPAWAAPVASAVGVLAVVFVVLVISAIRPVRYDPVLEADQEVRQGSLISAQLRFPQSLVRQEGIDHRYVRLRRVTDYDEDGVDEVWLEGLEHEYVVTFEPDGQWELIGRVPVGCVDRPGYPFPDLRCDGIDSRHTDGVYAPLGLDGAVVWFGKQYGPEGLTAENAPSPIRLRFTEPYPLGGFLVQRGVVDRPVHYLICEEALPGLRAQVLTEDGEVLPLAFGCLGDVTVRGRVDGDGVPGLPVMVAFTAEGREALLDDLRTFLTGSPTDLFLGPRDREAMERIGGPPQERGGALSLAVQGAPFMFRTVADEKPVEGLRDLVTSAVGKAPPRQAATVLVTAPGTTRVDPPGCSELEIDTGSFQCVLRRACTSYRSFLTVRQVGCGRDELLLRVPYGNKLVEGSDSDVEVRARIIAFEGATQTDVLRVEVGYRTQAEEEPGSSP